MRLDQPGSDNGIVTCRFADEFSRQLSYFCGASPRKYSVLSEEHSENANAPISVMPLGIVSDSNEVHIEKACRPIIFKVADNLTFVSAVQWKNAYSLISLMLSGIVTLVISVQFSNAFCFIAVTVLFLMVAGRVSTPSGALVEMRLHFSIMSVSSSWML